MLSMWTEQDTRSMGDFVAGLGTRFAVKDVGEASYDSTRVTTSSATGRTRSLDLTGTCIRQDSSTIFVDGF